MVTIKMYRQNCSESTAGGHIERKCPLHSIKADKKQTSLSHIGIKK